MNQHQQFEQEYQTKHYQEGCTEEHKVREDHTENPQYRDFSVGQSPRSQQQQHMFSVGEIPYMYSNPISLGSSLIAVLSYVFCWLSGLIILLFERENRFVRFHAMQSLLFFGSVNVFYVVFFSLIRHIPHFLTSLTVLAFLVLTLVSFIAWIVGMIGALRGSYVKLPIVGDIAERAVNENMHLRY